jgi:hypothetical protein
MNNDDTSNPNEAGVSRRATLTGVAALGVALGMRSNAFAQGKGEELPAGTLASIWVDIDATVADANRSSRDIQLNIEEAVDLHHRGN